MCQDITNSIKQGTLKIFMCYLTVVIYTLAELISTSDIVKDIAIWLMLSGDPGIICDKCFNISPWWTVIHDYTGRSKCWWRKEKLLLLILSVHNTWKTTDYSIKGQNVHPVVTNAVYMEKLLISPPLKLLFISLLGWCSLLIFIIGGAHLPEKDNYINPQQSRKVYEYFCYYFLVVGDVRNWMHLCMCWRD